MGKLDYITVNFQKVNELETVITGLREGYAKVPGEFREQVNVASAEGYFYPYQLVDMNLHNGKGTWLFWCREL